LPADVLDRLAVFTELTATAIANSDARTEIERLAEEQAALRHVATLVARGAETEEVFAAVAREVAEVMHRGRADHRRRSRLGAGDDRVH
jgi:pilus assembly protein TadC